jgi:hypothetical protein
MKLSHFARLVPVFVSRPLRLLLCSLTLCGTTLLTTVPARAQTFYRLLRFEQICEQASKDVHWLVQGYHFVTKGPLVHSPAPG